MPGRFAGSFRRVALRRSFVFGGFVSMVRSASVFRFRRWVAFAACGALGWLGGCGDGRPTRVPVSGSVMIDGKPLTSGSVFVIPEKARPAIGLIDKNGRFVLRTYDGEDGCVVGKHRIAVTATEAIGNRGVRWLAPKKYSDVTTSGLEITVENANKDAKLELSWGGGKPFEEYFEKE